MFLTHYMPHITGVTGKNIMQTVRSCLFINITPLGYLYRLQNIFVIIMDDKVL